MDGYPIHLAPEFEESGAVATSFEDCWPRVQPSFPHVPEEVARDWLHRHWSHSPFGWLPSADYRFELVEWPCGRLLEILTGWSNFSPNPTEAIEHGRYLAIEHRNRHGYILADYMIEHRTFPVPPIILANGDGHLASSVGAPYPYPPGFILVEGHRRFNIAAYLVSIEQLRETVHFWLMVRANAPRGPTA